MTNKKIITLFLAILYCSFTFAQETKNYPELTITSRFDINPYFSTNDNEAKSLDFGGSALYTLLEGNLGSSFSYSLCNHWLSTDPASLYQNTFHSDNSNWIDWITLTYSVGNFSFTLGKSPILIGSFEIDGMDYDGHSNLASTFWNNFAGYQWGGYIEYSTPSEKSRVILQVTSSPFNEYPFSEKFMSYSLGWYGEYDWYSSIFSTNFIEYEPKKFLSIIALAHRFDFDNLGIEINYMNRANSTKQFFNQEMTLVGMISYTCNDKFEFFVKGGYEYHHCEDDCLFFGNGWTLDNSFTPTVISNNHDYIFYGAGAYYYPLRNSQDLRLHTVISTNNYAEQISVNFGVTYNFNFTKTIL